MVDYISNMSYLNEPCRLVRYAFTKKADGTTPIFITGKYCSIGKNCTFVFAGHSMDTITTYPGPKECLSKGDIIIGNDVWIGTDVTILAGVKIHDGAVVGARSVVTKDVPPYAVVGGNPAKIIKYRFTEEQRAKLIALNIWELPDNVLKTIDFWTTDVDAFLVSAKQIKETVNLTVSGGQP